jgi:hypothetical protein
MLHCHFSGVAVKNSHYCTVIQTKCCGYLKYLFDNFEIIMMQNDKIMRPVWLIPNSQAFFAQLHQIRPRYQFLIG